MIPTLVMLVIQVDCKLDSLMTSDELLSMHIV